MIVVNKTDLLTTGEVDGLSTDLQNQSRQGVQVVQTSMGKLPVDVLLGQGVAAESDMATRHEVHHHHHEGHHDDHDHDDFESFIIIGPEIADPTTFETMLTNVITRHNILRLKGFTSVAGKPMRLTIQGVGPRIDSYFDRPMESEEMRQMQLVVIGQSGMDRSAIENALLS
jgi:cobalamin biosynthesis protein CobW